MNRLSNYIALIFVGTFLMLVYVHQQISIIQCSYRISKHEDELRGLVECGKKAKYRLTALKSPVNVEKQLAAYDINLVLPNEIGIVKIPIQPQPLINLAKNTESSDSFMNMLGFGKVAQAEENVQ